MEQDAVDVFGDESSDRSLFEEEDKEPEKPPPIIFERKRHNCKPKQIYLEMANKHSLWGHHLSNPAIVMAEFLDEIGEKGELTGKQTLELGSGSGLPSIIAALNNTKKVVCTDYPDSTLLNAIEHNAISNLPSDLFQRGDFKVKGHIWGKNIEELLNKDKEGEEEKYSVIIMSDLVFNHKCHLDLLQTCKQCISSQGKIYVSFTHHRPKYVEQDLFFFELAKQDPFNFKVKKLFSKQMSPQWPDDDLIYGNLDIRSTIHFYQLSYE